MFGKKDNGAVKEKKKSGVLLMIATVAVGAAVFVGLVSLQNSLIERPETVDVVVAKSTVADNSFIDKGKAGDYFQVIKVNKDAAAEGAYKTLDDVDKELPAYISNDMTKNIITRIKQRQDLRSNQSTEVYPEQYVPVIISQLKCLISRQVKRQDHMSMSMLQEHMAVMVHQ